MTTRATEIEAELGTWPGVTTDASRFECCEFSLGVREIGRLYGGAEIEIPFDKRVRDALLESGVDVTIHRVYPDSGWLTYELDGDESIDRALALLRLSYLTKVAVLQQRGTADQELSLLDVDRELAALDLPDDVRGVVRELFGLDRRADESAAGERTTDDAEARERDDTGESTPDDTDDQGDRTDRSDREPDDGIPSPT